MTTITPTLKQWTQAGTIPAGGLNTSGVGGVQVNTSLGAVILQDPAGNQIVVSQIDLNNPLLWQVTAGQWQTPPQIVYTVQSVYSSGGDVSNNVGNLVDDLGGYLVQDPQGNQVYISSEDFRNPAKWTILTP